jgi:hypothetical protein
MYYNFENSEKTYRAPRAHEIELRVREMEKKTALMNAISHHTTHNSFTSSLKSTARRLSSLMSSLFLS